MNCKGLATSVALVFAAMTSMTSSVQAQDPPTTAMQKQELAQGKFQELTVRMEKLMVVLQKVKYIK